MLFAYGTLRDPDILCALLDGATARLKAQPAQALDFRAVYYPQRHYPALVTAPGRNADGLLIHGLTAEDFVLLDAFEGDEYRRSPITIFCAERRMEIDTYLPTTPIAPTAPDWTLEEWVDRHKPENLSREQDQAKSLRQQLRPQPPYL